MIVYHATKKSRLPNILKHGLKPTQGGGLNPEDLGGAPRGIYLCHDWIDATHVLAMMDYDGDDIGAILVIDLPDYYVRYKDPRAVATEPGFKEWSFYITEPIPPEFIKEVL